MTTLSAPRGTSTLEPPRAVEVPSGGRWYAVRRQLVPWLFLIPGLGLAMLFKFGPMLEGVRMSFYKVQPFLGDEWLGLGNYATVVGDPRFIDALRHTLILAAGTTLGALVLGGLLALLMEGTSRRLWVVRTAVFLPVVTAVAVVAEVWRIILFPTETGFANQALGVLGLPAQQFLSDPSSALLWVMVVGIWTAAPYNMVIILAGLVGIDRVLYEAAAVDGITTRQRLRYIVLPALRPAISVVLTLAAIRALRIFTEVYVLTGGGPAGSTEVWMTRTFSLGFDANNLGVASAASVLLLIATLLLTVVARTLTRRKEA
ncbi:carbohydrate ABC transporter permease [Isoptericola croceus]|uniref:carbohydrate ABC transporter permease n=1 Tax=Isoptericola croceus TaxID=3031406 RepID=UPI0023F82D07|nr:sugar ABC transporter permease [Isoptericola croceus]